MENSVFPIGWSTNEDPTGFAMPHIASKRYAINGYPDSKPDFKAEMKLSANLQTTLDSANSSRRCASVGNDSSFEKLVSASKSFASMGKQELPICFDFVQGKCRRVNCRYQHDFGAVIRHNARESRVCFDHLRGECTRGNLCRFSHDIKRLVLQGIAEAAFKHNEPTANGICYDFCRGACPRKGTCPWTHNLVEIAWNTDKQPLSQKRKYGIYLKVLEVIRQACPRHISEPAISRMISQPIFRAQLSALCLPNEAAFAASAGIIILTTSAPDTLPTSGVSPRNLSWEDSSQLSMGFQCGLLSNKRSEDGFITFNI